MTHKNIRGPALAGLMIASAVAGCAGPSEVDWARPFPTQKKQIRTADIQVVRRETMISFTNTTAHEFGPGTIWINGQWALPMEGLDIGESRTLDLRSFRNEFSEKFRAGGFFAVERPTRLVRAQYEVDDGLIGFIVVRDPTP